jgi:hypothetical protein
MISLTTIKNVLKGAFSRMEKNNRFSKFVQSGVNSSSDRKTSLIKRTDPGIRGLSTSPVSKRTTYLDQGELLLPQSSWYDNSFRIKLHRFLRDNIPVLNSAIWTWTHICASSGHSELEGS